MMVRHLIIFLLFINFIFGNVPLIEAQISQRSIKPLSSRNDDLQKKINKENIQTIHLPSLSNQKQRKRAKRIKQKECPGCKKGYWGTGIDTTINVHETATEFKVKNGTVKVLKISSETALGLQFFFQNFKLPRGAILHIYNKDKSMRLGAYTHENNRENNKLAVQPIKGNDITIEYFLPENVMLQNELKISKVVHDFEGVYSKKGPFGSSGSCNVDVNCVTPPVFEDQISSVGLIFVFDCSNNLSGTCSGALINNTSQNATPYFLTANHCFGGGCTNNWVFLFNHEEPQCLANHDTSTVSLYQTISGATTLSNGASSDYGLLELNATPPPSYNVCYAGWDKSGNTPNLTFGAHHPSGDEKKFSYDASTPLKSGYNNSCNVPSGNSHWGVIWDLGTTEGGSSGSPLFNQNGQIIGQLHGGCAGCSNPNEEDFYGRLSQSWINGGFGQWLDPANTGASTLGTYCPYQNCNSLTTFNSKSNCLSDGSGSSDYNNVANCRWRIQPPGNSQIKLTFNSFDTESLFDHLHIYDGQWEDATSLGSFSGNSTPSPILSTNDTVYLQFITDTTITNPGWELCYCTMPTATVSPDITICEGESTSLSASGGESYQWSPSNGLSCTNCASPTASPTSTTTYNVTVTNGNNCHDNASVTVNVTPSSVVDAGTDKEICAGENTVLNASGGSSYNWSPSNGLSCTNCQSPTASPNNTTTYTVTATSGNGCQSTDNVTVTVNAKPNANASQDLAICEGESANLSATGGNTYTWSPGTGLSCANCQSPTANPTNTITYTVTVTDANGCEATDDVTVTVHSQPNVSTGPDKTICKGESTTLSASGGSSYTWYPGTGLSCVNCQNPTASPTNTVTYSVTVKDANNCEATGNITVTVDNCTGIITKEDGLNSVRIYPNPTEGVFVLQYPKVDNQSLEIKIYDLTGRLLHQNKFQNKQGENKREVDVNHLAKGVYYLQLLTEKGEMNKKIIIK